MPKNINIWKTSDIRVTKDREGFFDATHKYQGALIVSGYYPDHAAARRAAVVELKELKALIDSTPPYSPFEDSVEYHESFV